MVRTKATPRHADVWPPKCVVYITRNPVTFVIQRHRDLFLLDQQAREKKQEVDYKRHVHKPPAKPATTVKPKNTAHNRCHQTTTIYHWRWQFSREHWDTSQLQRLQWQISTRLSLHWAGSSDDTHHLYVIFDGDWPAKKCSCNMDSNSNVLYAAGLPASSLPGSPLYTSS